MVRMPEEQVRPLTEKDFIPLMIIKMMVMVVNMLILMMTMTMIRSGW